MHLGRVIGRLVATHRYPGLEGVPLQLVQPLDASGQDAGASLVACAVVPSGPGDTVHFIDGREAAIACPETFVPVDATIMGVVEEATNAGQVISGSIAGGG
ncbi:MAG: EutN/CcmL family microcompartment protein [Planctomycetes bacterium]|nr:EutN/CcmL family microcompartment protein [Planctomycetota bacterium]